MDKKFKYTIAIARGIAKSLPAEAQRMDQTAELVSYEKAKSQHQSYVDILKNILGLKVIQLPADEALPDCVFVEDVTVAIDNTALITKPGHVNRIGEMKEMESCLKTLGMNVVNMNEIDPFATVDGGDVLFTGEEIFVGVGNRSNLAGYKVICDTFPSYAVHAVEVEAALHLKTACSLAKPGVIMISKETPELQKMIKAVIMTMQAKYNLHAPRKTTFFVKRLQDVATKNYRYISVEGNAVGSNCLFIDSEKLGSVTVHPSLKAFPLIKSAYDAIGGVTLIECDNRELSKVDGALTCCFVLLSI